MSSLYLKIPLMIMVLLPGAFSKLFSGAESFKEGLLVASLSSSLILMICGQKVSKSSARKMLKRALAIIVFLMLHGALTMFGVNFNAFRFLLSISFFVLIFFLWAPIIESLEDAREEKLDAALRLCYWVLLADGVISTCSHVVTGSKVMIFFSEPSHFALIFLPFLSYMLFRGGVFLHLAASLTVATFINNLTLLIGVALLVVFHYKRRLVILFAIFAFGVSVAMLSPGYSDYVVGRLTLSAETDNLTALVFMSGYERAYATLVQGSLLGVGFQQMGFVGPSGELLDVISRVTNGYESNLYDGGTLASKLIVEFGLFGLVFILLYLFGLKKIFSGAGCFYEKPRDRFFVGVYITFFCYMFVRGVGYMSPSVFIFIFAAFTMIGLRPARARLFN